MQRLLLADRLALQLRDCVDDLTPALAIAARSFNDKRAWTVFGCARAEDYCRERFDRSARWLRRLALLGRAFDTLPGFEAALTGEDGGMPLGRSRAIEIATVATPESAAAWVRFARGASVRDVIEVVRVARREERPWPPAPIDATGASDPHPGAPAIPAASVDCAAQGGADEATASEGLPDEHVPRCEVRLPIPPPMRVAFDEVRQLHNAVSGHELPVSDFIEALVAESLTGPVPVDVDRVPLRRARTVGEAERALAAESAGWTWLDQVDVAAAAPRDRVFERLRDDAAELIRQLGSAATAGSPAPLGELDAWICRLIDLEDRVERQIGRLLEYMGNRNAWLQLQFDGVEHYAAERLSLNRRMARDRSRAAKAVKRLPILRAAYEEGRLGLQATLIVARVLNTYTVPRATERAWVDHAQEIGVRRLRDEARVADREWMEHGSYAPRPPLDDDEWLRSLALFPGTIRRRFDRLVGVAGSDAHRDTFTYLTLRLEDERAHDLLVAIEDRRVRLGGKPSALPGLSESSVDPSAVGAMRSQDNVRLTFSVDGAAQSLPDAPRALQTAAAFRARGLDVPCWVGLLALLEEYVATWDPTRVRRRSRYGAIYGRDGQRCTAPWCTSRKCLDAHHIEPLGQGGPDEPGNISTVCHFHHHLGVHGHLAACTGKAPLDVIWRLGREDVSRWFHNERAVARP